MNARNKIQDGLSGSSKVESFMVKKNKKGTVTHNMNKHKTTVSTMNILEGAENILQANCSL